MSISWVRASCKIWLVSYDSKHTLQSLSHTPFMCTLTHDLKTTDCIWTLYILNDCFTVRDITCVCFTELHEISDWRDRPQTHIDCSLIQYCHVYTASLYTDRYLLHNYTHDNKTHVAYDCTHTPNDGFSANAEVIIVLRKWTPRMSDQV